MKVETTILRDGRPTPPGCELFELRTGDVTFLQVAWLGLVLAPQRGLRPPGAQNAGELFQYPNGDAQNVAQLYTNNA